MVEVLGRTKVCCVIGDPIEHSLSPAMYNAAFHNLSLDFIFVPFRVSKEHLVEALAGIRGLNIRGFAVTIPHKTAVIDHLDDIDPLARAIGAVNVVDQLNDKLTGYNSDGFGAVKSLEEKHIQLKGCKVVMLGAGGAAKAISYYLAERCAELVILNRTPTSAQTLAEKLKEKFFKQIRFLPLSPQNLADTLKDANLLINATSIGMYPRVNQSLVDKDLLRADLCVFDIVYNPVETRLLLDAKAVGAKIVNGAEMLVYQGAFAFEKWTGCKAPIKVMREMVLSKLPRSQF